MNNIKQAKDQLRKKISSLKKEYSPEDLDIRSQEVLSVLEITGAFQDAKTIFIYNNLQDEVQTFGFIQKWSDKKNFYLPAVVGNDIAFRKYISSVKFEQSPLGIMEPEGDDFIEYKKVDLIIVPGVAFDRNKNRLGRGRGYYDRFLSKLKSPKIGICFEFQLLDNIPNDENDIKMDYIVSENELIW